MDDRGKNLAMAYAVKRRAKKMAGGGEVEHHSPAGGSANRAKAAARSRNEEHQKGVHRSQNIYVPGSSQAGYNARALSEGPVFKKQAMDNHEKVRSEASKIEPKLQGLAHGGSVEEEDASGYEHMPEEHDEMNESAEHEDDIVSRCMAKREHMYSEGGRVANGGEDDLEDMADGKPNNFDDLSLRDDLDFSYDGANSGDELGNEQHDKEDHDVVARIMRSRAKKDRNPRPA